jgi:aminopeptidase N
VIRAGALDGMAALRDDGALEVVAKRTRYGVPTRGRRAAVHALASLGEGRKTREQLEELLEDKDPHFKIDVVSALSTLGDNKSRGAMRRALDRELDGRVTRRLREALRDMGDSPTSEKKRLNDELESVRDELTELKNRLAKLEARKTDKPKVAADAKPAAAKVAPLKAVASATLAAPARSAKSTTAKKAVQAKSATAKKVPAKKAEKSAKKPAKKRPR